MSQEKRKKPLRLDATYRIERDPKGADYLLAKEAANVLRYSENKFRALVRDGTLPQPVRVGNRKLWRRGDLERHLSGESKPESDAEKSKRILKEARFRK